MKQPLLTICLLFILFAPELSRAQKPELVVQTGHSDFVYSIAFSPDGKTLASCSKDKTVKLWEVSTGTELRTLTGHSGAVESVAFSPDGKTVASGGEDKVIKLWEVSTGTELRTLEGHSGKVNSVAFSPDGKTLAAGSEDKTISLWEVSSSIALRTLKAHAGRVNSVAFSPDGKTLASGGMDDVARLWQVSSGIELRTLKGHANWVVSVTFSPDGKTLATGSWDSTIKLWEVSTGRELRTLKSPSTEAELRTLRGFANHVHSVDFSPDGKTLASASFDKMVKLWDVSTGTRLRTLEGHSSRVNSVDFSPDGKILGSGCFDQTAKLWEVTSGNELRTLKGHSSMVSSVAFSSDGKTLASGSGADKTAKLWDVSSGTKLHTLKGHSKGIKAIALSPDGRILASGSDDNTIKLWEISTGTELHTLKGKYSDRFESIAFSPDGKTLAGASGYTTINLWDLKLWDVSTGTELRSLTGQSSWVESVAFSPDGKTLAVGSADKTLSLWEVSSGRVLRTFKGVSSSIMSVAFSPDGNTLASGGLYEVTLWQVSTGTVLRTLKAHSAWVSSVVFSPDGKTLASGSWDRTIKLWEASTGTELRTLKGHAGMIRSVAFSLDGQNLVSGSGDTTPIKIWDVSSGKELASLIAFDEHDWIIVTPDGLFDGPPAAWKKLIWRASQNTFDFAPVEAYFSDFYHPGLLADLFAGRRPKAPSDISQKDRRQPKLNLAVTNAQPETELTERTVTVTIDVAEPAADKDHRGSGAQDVRLFRNGSLVKVWRGDVLKGQSRITLEARVPIVAGENRLTAYAFNHDNIKSNDASLTITGADSLKRKGAAYILAVGVNNYSNSQYNLKYAVADAREFSAEVKRQQELLKRYAQVEVISLADTAATKANMVQKLTQLATRVQPEDAVIIYFAGHGTAHGKQFYLIPHDLGYRGRRDKLNEAGLRTVLAHSISDRELEKLFEGIDAGQLLLVIDACNSGQALEAEEKRRGPMNSKGLAQLAYEKGMYVLTAAQSYQAAQEAAKFGHGFLTYALVEDGLKQGKADREPKDRSINLREWLNYATEQVPRMQEENMLDALRGRSRFIDFSGDGSESNNPGKSNVQRPRIFYRRELDANPLVVAIIKTSAHH